MTSQPEGWRLPQGFSMPEMSEELGIEPFPLPQIGTEITALNNAFRKRGIEAFTDETEFKRMFSSVYHYEEMGEKLCDSVWDSITRGTLIY
jgi:hypothetical protein